MLEQNKIKISKWPLCTWEHFPFFSQEFQPLIDIHTHTLLSIMQTMQARPAGHQNDEHVATVAVRNLPKLHQSCMHADDALMHDVNCGA